MDYVLLPIGGLTEARVSSLRAALLRLSYSVSAKGPRGLLVANAGAAGLFHERLAKLAQHFNLEAAEGVETVDVGSLRTYNKESRGARQVIAEWGDQVLRQVGILDYDEVRVLDTDFPLRLAYFLRSAAGAKIEQPETPDLPHDHHVFAVAGRRLMVTGLNQYTASYLLRLRAGIAEYLAATPATEEEQFEADIARIAGHLHQQTGEYLSQLDLWEQDGLL